MTRIMGIDVGINAIGWCVIEVDLTKKMVKIRKPLDADYINVPHKMIKETADDEDWAKRVEYLVDELDPIFERYSPSRVYIEYPEFQSSSGKGIAAAVRGNLTQLAMSAGAHYLQATLFLARPFLVPVSVWKGQLSKEIVEKRLSRLFSSRYSKTGAEIKSHAWDAAGLAVYGTGVRMDDPRMAKKPNVVTRIIKGIE